MRPSGGFFHKLTSAIGAMFLVAVLSWGAGTAYATSWVSLSAEEVVRRADLIVLGTYDLGEANKWRSGMWVPVPFQVEAVYRGQAEARIDAAIEQYDVGLTRQAQEEGRRFLLFLQRNPERGPEWIPVGGPNGMIQVQGEQALHERPEFQAVYREIMAGPSSAPLATSDSRAPWAAVAGGAAAAAGGVAAYYRKRRRR